MTSDDDAPKQAAPAAKPAMSRFLKTAADSDSSDESSDEESKMSSDDEDVRSWMELSRDYDVTEPGLKGALPTA